MEFGEYLSLSQAAKFANVSEPTMRNWVKSVTNVERNVNGGYLIPRADLTAFLGAKADRKFGATASQGHQEFRQELPQGLRGVSGGETLEGVIRARDKAEAEVQFLRERVVELNEAMARLTHDYSSLSREFFEIAIRGSTPGLSSWTNKIREQHEPKRAEAVDAELVTQPVAKPVTITKVKPKAKAAVKVAAKKPKSKEVKKKAAKKSSKRSKSR